jgi:tRNA pseudouridine55 synthase
LAREGAVVELAARPVRVYGIELLDYAWPDVRVRIDCGRGTYIRSIARDLGAALDCGGHLTALRRTAIGTFRAADAVTLEALKERGVNGLLHPVPPVVVEQPPP